MTHPYIANGEAWAMSLRELMGYPSYAPSCRTMAWVTGQSPDAARAMQVAQIARDLGRNAVLLGFEGMAPGAPVSISLAVRQHAGVEWIADCTPYAATETAKIELLGGGRRWHIGARLILTSLKLPPKDRCSNGEAIAMRRWRQTAATMEPLNMVGSLFVASGKTFAEAVPTAALRIAA
jgi:hypothetical protein